MPPTSVIIATICKILENIVCLKEDPYSIFFPLSYSFLVDLVSYNEKNPEIFQDIFHQKSLRIYVLLSFSTALSPAFFSCPWYITYIFRIYVYMIRLLSFRYVRDALVFNDPLTYIQKVKKKKQQL